MSDVARSRIDGELKRKAESILKDVGISPRAALEMFYAQIIKLHGLPFRPSAFPVLEEYGVTVEDAERAADRAIREFDAERQAGRTQIFSGKLPK